MESAWTKDNKYLTDNMIKGALAELPGWKRLENSNHFYKIYELINKTNIKEICDLGCGSGELGRVMSRYGYKYVGYDLPHIINKVSKNVNPQFNYFNFDANNFDYSILKIHKLIVVNSFISELENAADILKQILDNVSGFLLIHRQKINSLKTTSKYYNTYGGLKTIQTSICMHDLNKLLINHVIVDMSNIPELGSDVMSILIKNKDFN
jgi:2-polyprenyl-3-methyl-5-hydroxy-6-metoxy-1,4-benzoquinol methylase